MMLTYASIINDMEFTVELMLAEVLFLLNTEKKKNYVFNGILTVLTLSMVSIFLGYETISRNQELMLLKFIIRWGMILFLSIAGMLSCYDISVSRALLYGVGGYAIQNMAFSIHQCLKSIWVMILPNIPFGDIQNIVTIIMVFGITYIISYYCFAKKISEMKCMIETWKVICIALGIILIVIVLSSMCHSMDERSTIIFRTLSMLGCILCLTTMKEMYQSRENQMELQIIQHQTLLREQYYDMLRINIDAVNSRCHDLKHQITKYRVQNGQTTVHVPDDVLRDLEDSINVYDSVVKTGNEDLDTVLTDKSLLCHKEKIQFTYMIDEKSIGFMNGNDIYSLFGNILDNAIEAVTKINNSSKKVINMSIVRKGAFINIHSYNYYETPIIMENGIPQTTKKDSFFHGYGMKSIRMIVDKYEGEMVITAEDNIFDINIVFPAIHSC